MIVSHQVFLLTHQDPMNGTLGQPPNRVPPRGLTALSHCILCRAVARQRTSPVSKRNFIPDEWVGRGDLGLSGGPI